MEYGAEDISFFQNALYTKAGHPTAQEKKQTNAETEMTDCAADVTEEANADDRFSQRLLFNCASAI